MTRRAPLRCDSHVPIVGDAAGLIPNRAYTPPLAPVAGILRLVVIRE